jgi:hypothetical protein
MGTGTSAVVTSAGAELTDAYGQAPATNAMRR